MVGYLGPKRHLLLVDDQSDQRAVVRNMLAPLGFTIAEAVDGEECLDLLRKFRPDALLVDPAMPGMSGWDLSRMLRAERQWQGPIIVISASGFENAHGRAARSGCDGFVAKPVRRMALLEQLQLHLALDWVRGTAPVDSNPEVAEFPAIPPAEYLLAIREYARIGYVKGISEEIERLFTLDLLYHRYATRLREMARQFRTDEIIEFIEESLHHECDPLQS